VVAGQQAEATTLTWAVRFDDDAVRWQPVLLARVGDEGWRVAPRQRRGTPKCQPTVICFRHVHMHAGGGVNVDLPLAAAGGIAPVAVERHRREQ
jgi:hypothetical protein